jgi:hypothetical protein
MRGEASCWRNVPAIDLDCAVRGNRCSQLHLDYIVRSRKECCVVPWCPVPQEQGSYTPVPWSGSRKLTDLKCSEKAKRDSKETL